MFPLAYEGCLARLLSICLACDLFKLFCRICCPTNNSDTPLIFEQNFQNTSISQQRERERERDRERMREKYLQLFLAGENSWYGDSKRSCFKKQDCLSQGQSCCRPGQTLNFENAEAWDSLAFKSKKVSAAVPVFRIPAFGITTIGILLSPLRRYRHPFIRIQDTCKPISRLAGH